MESLIVLISMMNLRQLFWKSMISILRTFSFRNRMKKDFKNSRKSIETVAVKPEQKVLGLWKSRGLWNKDQNCWLHKKVIVLILRKTVSKSGKNTDTITIVGMSVMFIIQRSSYIHPFSKLKILIKIRRK